MELVVLVITGVVIYYVVTGLTRWWNGYRNRHNLPLQVVALTVVVLVAVWVSQSATGARVADLAIGAVLVFGVLAVAVLAVAGWRRGRSRRAAESEAMTRPRRPPTRRSGSRWKSVDNAAGREVFVYAMGAFDKRNGECRTIKIGSSTAPELRLAQVQDEQVGRTETVRLLGWGPGGERRENMMHRRLNDWRYEASEWFEPSPEVLAAVAKLERLTDDGRQLTQATTTRSASQG